jgi:ABC-type transporter Mla MlaB component
VSEQTTINFVVRGPIARSDLPGLCDRLGDLIAEHSATCAICDVGDLAPDAVAVDALARLRLEARQQGCALRLDGCSKDLSDLMAFLGLRGLLLR